jgi:hypothetical protein
LTDYCDRPLSKPGQQSSAALAGKVNPLENQSWDAKAVHEYFLRIAVEKERYLSEVKRKVATSEIYKGIYDQFLAEFYVYNFFHGRTFLSSREAPYDSFIRCILPARCLRIGLALRHVTPKWDAAGKPAGNFS